MIEKLEKRNKKLLTLLRKNDIQKNNHSEELQFSIEKDLVRNFWIGCKG